MIWYYLNPPGVLPHRSRPNHGTHVGAVFSHDLVSCTMPVHSHKAFEHASSDPSNIKS
jgi:hypothetical protein